MFKERNAISSSQTLEEAEVGCGRGHCFSELLSGGLNPGCTPGHSTPVPDIISIPTSVRIRLHSSP